MRTAAGHALHCAEDLALKSFVGARFARQQMAIERAESSWMAGTEQKIAQLE